MGTSYQYGLNNIVETQYVGGEGIYPSRLSALGRLWRNTNRERGQKPRTIDTELILIKRLTRRTVAGKTTDINFLFGKPGLTEQIAHHHKVWAEG